MMGKCKKKSIDRPENWDKIRVAHWLESIGFEKYKALLCDEHQIDGKSLLCITEEDLKGPPLQLKVLGDIKRLSNCISQLQQKKNSTNGSADAKSSVDSCMQHRSRISATARRQFQQNSSESSDGNYASSEASWDEGYGSAKLRDLKPEIWKTVFALLYFVSVTWITAIVMVIVHDRVPDMQTYPPLPDIFLDNVPLIPWAFTMCEFTGLVLFLIWFFILIMHKHRFILLRRMFSLFGSVFLLRCVTMLITSLSVPGKHLQCKARPYGNWWQKLYQACIIWLGGGMSIQGVRTCGDYMFSGHTVALTLLNFFITEYTPRRMYYLHTFTWVLNLFGIFFILAAHEHYSIDVFIAFYISTRLFLYYHTLANNRALMQDDGRRTRIWFPLFYFFESGVQGTVPSEYEWPIKIPQFIKDIFSSS